MMRVLLLAYLLASTSAYADEDKHELDNKDKADKQHDTEKYTPSTRVERKQYRLSAFREIKGQ